MTCSGEPGAEFEFITRPVVYPRQPFQLASGELLTYESRFFSLPAYSLLADKRLFTDEALHPITLGDIKLYINKDAGVSPIIEPSLSGDEYGSGTPHYADYITDLRALLVEVFDLHAADSDWLAADFLEEHFARTRAAYTTDVPNNRFVHLSPTNTVPSGTIPLGSSGSIPSPGDGYELGAQQFMDVDMDEVQYQPFIRPKSKAETQLDGGITIPTDPIFPHVITTAGTTPTLNSLDEEKYTELALGVHASGGGLLVTGDALVGGPTALGVIEPSIKLMSASGQTGVVGVSEGAFQEVIPWALYPAKKELCSYYTPDVAINTINASGRQAIFAIPDLSFTNNTVLLLNVSEVSTSGQKMSNYPSNYQATSGIDANGHAHNGLHVCNKLIYNLTGAPAVGFSPVNGQRMFAHFIGGETGSKGETWGGAGPKYQNGDALFAAGGIVTAFDGTIFSTVNWANTNNRFAPVIWESLRTSALGPRRTNFGTSVTFSVADIQAGADRGVLTIKTYAQWGFIDQVVTPDKDQAQGGQRIDGVINYITHTYKEGKGSDGNFQWIELEDSPTSSSNARPFYQDTYFINNIWSFFFARKNNNGLVHANGEVYIQWSDRSNIAGIEDLPRKNLFAPFGEKVSVLVPPSTRTDVIITIGFFPNWARRRTVTTNNQILIPFTLNLSPADSLIITFDPLLEFDDTFVNEFGAPVWDPDEGVNYIYFLWAEPGNPNKRLFFAHMDSNFVIFRINQVNDSGSALLFGRPALLSI